LSSVNQHRPTSYDIVAKLWGLCNTLKDDGVTYHQYVTELTYLLFLKMAKETGTENQLPDGFRWDDLVTQPVDEQLNYYTSLLKHLHRHGSRLVKEIFEGAVSSIKKSPTLSLLVTDIDRLDWYSAKQEGLGDIYEGLLEKNASEKKSGAGQYFTPRALIDSIVSVMKPTIDDVIQDPAAGTGGFLIAANRYIIEHSDVNLWTEKQRHKYLNGTFFGMEHVHDTYRLALMNLFLHGLNSEQEGAGIRYGDTLSPDGAVLPRATLILSNPPFGKKKGGGLPTRKDLPFSTSNKQLCFLQHIYLALKPGGRAAVVVPDNVLFESNIGRQVRVDLMNKCNLHMVLKLPTGIFYAQGVKTNVLFFTRGKSDVNNTKTVWVYDLRASMPNFGKRMQLSRSHFTNFEEAFGDDPRGQQKSITTRIDTGEQGRLRKYTREWIAERGDNLNISWLKDENEEKRNHSQDPAVILNDAMNELTAALKELRALMKELNEEVYE